MLCQNRSCDASLTDKWHIILYREFSASFRDDSVVRENGNERQVVAFTALVIVGIVGRSNFDGSGSEFPIHEIVEKDRQTTIRNKRMNHTLALVLLVPGFNEI